MVWSDGKGASSYSWCLYPIEDKYNRWVMSLT